MCYYEIEPWGEQRADLRAGIVASTMANTARDPKKKAKPFEASDFMPKFEPSDPQEPNALLAKVEAINAAFGGVDKRAPENEPE
jgi:hypothetical protein